jgi:hypothetical protein
MTQRGVAGILVAFVTILIGVAIFFVWHMQRKPPVPLPTWDGAVWAPNNWDSMELLDVDDDGSLLVAFYDGTRQIDSYTGEKYNVGEQPGIVLVTPDGASHVLSEPAALDASSAGWVTGSVHHGSIAVAWQVLNDAIGPDGSMQYGSSGRTVEVATGTVEGLSDIPGPTIDGSHVVIESGGLYVADGALVAMTVDEGPASASVHHLGLLDPTTGAIAVIESGAFYPATRDLCDPEGATFGVPKVVDRKLVEFQFRVTAGHASAMSVVPKPLVEGNFMPLNACGAGNAGLLLEDHTLYWTDGHGETSSSVIGYVAGDVFLGPTWAVVRVLDFKGADLKDMERRVVVVDRTTREVTTVGGSCSRVVPAGDWLAFGIPDGDRCVPVAVRVSTLLTP